MSCTNEPTDIASFDCEQALEAKDNKIDELTEMLCRLGHIIKDSDLMQAVPKDIRKWWTKHWEWYKRKREEEARVKKQLATLQKMKKQALSKLTDEERKALGL